MSFIRAFAREFVGEKPRKIDLVTIFIFTFILLAVLGYCYRVELSEISIWKVALFLLMTFDIIGGAIGNFTKSTQQWYMKKPSKRITFYFEHLIHIFGLYLAVGYPWYCFGLLVFAIVGGMIVNYTRSLKQQEINAACIMLIGYVLFYVVFPAPYLLAWLPAIFLLKIVMGFSIKREISS